MCRKIGEAKEIVRIKQEIANGRDYLQRILDHSRCLVSRLQLKLKTVRKQWHRESMEKELEKHQLITQHILDSMQDANVLAVSPSDSKVLSTITVFISRIRALQKKVATSYAGIANTFRGVYNEFATMVENAIELKKLVT